MPFISNDMHLQRSRSPRRKATQCYASIQAEIGQRRCTAWSSRHAYTLCMSQALTQANLVTWQWAQGMPLQSLQGSVRNLLNIYSWLNHWNIYIPQELYTFFILGITPTLSLMLSYAEKKRVNVIWICRDPGKIQYSDSILLFQPVFSSKSHSLPYLHACRLGWIFPS